MEWIAHRGASGTAPENTLAAFRLAWATGADGIELDVHLSSDGQALVHHDASTQRTAGVDLDIATTPSEQLRQLDVGKWYGAAFAGERIPLLTEVLATVPSGKQAWIEVKSGVETVAAVAAAIHASRVSAAMMSFELAVLVACRERFPIIPCYWILDETSLTGKSPDADQIDRWIACAQQHRFAGLNLHHRLITADSAAQFMDSSLAVLAWTVDDPYRAQQLATLGVKAIATNYPETLRRLVTSNQ